MTTYEPGMVAVATVRGVPNVRVMRSTACWLHPAMNGHIATGDTLVTDVRPLVVLDLAFAPYGPEVTIHTLKEGCKERGSLTAQWVAKEIEAQIRPLKPAEPTGLGAVVEDVHGGRWVRCARNGSAPWLHASITTRLRAWSAFDAVRVLSEGVDS